MEYALFLLLVILLGCILAKLEISSLTDIRQLGEHTLSWIGINSATPIMFFIVGGAMWLLGFFLFGLVVYYFSS